MVRGGRAWRWAGRAFALCVAAIWLACGVNGERARTGECPADETCAPETPEGLNFRGAGTTDEPLESALPTAVGGVQSYYVGRAVRWGSSDDPLPAFDAVFDDPSIFAIDAVADNVVTVRALAPGTALLRIVDESGELLDRTPLRAVDVERVELRAFSHLFVPWHGPWAFFRGGRSTVIFALYDGAGERAIDQSARPEAYLGTAPVAWDAVDADLRVEGSELTLAIELGSGRRVASAPLVDRVDRIARTDWSLEELMSAPRVPAGGGSAHFCFVGLSGGHAVAGLAFEIATEGPIEATPDLAWDELTPPGLACVFVDGLEAGVATLIVRAGGLERRQRIEVVE